MKTLPRLILLLPWICPICSPAEVLEVLRTRDGREYLKVEIIANDEVGLRIRHEAGTARIPFQNLPDDVRRKYHFDPAKAAARKELESRSQLEHEKSQQPEPKPPRPPNDPLSPDSDSLDAGKIQPPEKGETAKLESYIMDMRSRIRAANVKMGNLRAEARTERSRTRTKVTGYDKKGIARKEVVPDKAGHVKADNLDAEAAAIERQILRAGSLLAKAERDYETLTGRPMSPDTGLGN